jgi:hypothetical protein
MQERSASPEAALKKHALWHEYVLILFHMFREGIAAQGGDVWASRDVVL